MNSIVCPISKEKTNRCVVRITGFLVASTMLYYALTLNIYIIFFLSIDFYIRAFTSLKISPYSFLARNIASMFKFNAIPIGKAPKIFAARVGFLFTITIILLYFVNPVASLFIGFTLMSFALLESLFNVCVGCIVYTYLVLPKSLKG